MKFLFVTLFPEQIEQAASHSILQRAAAKGLIEVSCINPRDFTHDVHRTVDDSPFGGGAGMVLKPEPMVAAIRKAKEQLPNARVIAMCPGGRTLKQSIVEEYAHSGQDFIFVCGHYEGFDEPVKNVMKIRGNEMTLTKRGIINVQMNFEAGKKNLTRYQTPYGVMMIGLDTSRVVCLQEEKSLAIEIDYTLEANYQYVSDSKIRIMVRERKQQA